MKMLKVMEKRRSVRDYKEKSLDLKDLELVQEYLLTIPQVVKDTEIKMTLVEGTQVYERLTGVAGYHGLMIKAPHYVLITAKPSPRYLESAGYAGEWFVLNLTRHDIGTCWISTSNQEAMIHARLQLQADEEIVGIIALGYSKAEMRVSTIYGHQLSADGSKAMSYRHVDSEFIEKPVSGRLSIEEFVFSKEWGRQETVEHLESLGYLEAFFYMRLAPSAGNRQPWRFIIDRDQFILAMSKDDGYDDDRLARIEAGIAMLYFEVAMHGEGYPGHWKFDVVEDKYGIPNNYFAAGAYTFM